MANVGRVTHGGHMSTQHTVHIPEWTLGDRLRKAREDAGFSQDELATAVKVSRATISNAEVGARVPLRVTIAAWAEATGVPESWLLGGGDHPPKTGQRLPRLDSNQKPPGLRYPPRLTGAPMLKVA